MSLDTLWYLISQQDPVDDFLIAGTETLDEDDVPKDIPGVAANHSYTILGTHVLSNNNKRLIKIRNPWGKPGFHGTMKGAAWNEETREETGYKDGKDGIFFIDLETYKKAFTETSISFNTANWASAKFLKTNDETQSVNPGKWQGVCGPKCTRHELTLKSDIKQTIYLTAQTWGVKSIPDSCEKKDNGLYHAIVVSKSDDVNVFSFGDKALAPFDMKAGETVKVEVEWNFTNEAHAKDWSVSAFGDGSKGSLHLTHDKGYRSDSWRPIPRQEPIKKPAP
mmetsp:Transcript_17530/g.22220  ORF Transcript_17530/g.22220 Transcript_17530/m.22220 type:complete len:279 (-) Transcript_17530:520-1356(-)